MSSKISLCWTMSTKILAKVSHYWVFIIWLSCSLFLQVSLGVLTLVHYVPTSLAASHQAGAMTLLTFALWLMSELRKKLPKL